MAGTGQRESDRQDESQRLLELGRYSALGPASQVDLDRIVRTAARVAATEVALVSLVGRDRISHPACVGEAFGDTDRGASFCDTVVCGESPLVVADARADGRFSRLPAVAAPGGLVFYAGVPLVTPRGHAIGTLCVLDRAPRPDGLDAGALATLVDLAALAVRVLDGHQAERRWQDYLDVATDWIWEQDADCRFTFFSDGVFDKVRMPGRDIVGKTRFEFMGIDPASDPLWAEHKAGLDARQPFRDFRYTRTVGDFTHTMSISGKPFFAPDGTFQGYRGIGRDVTAEEQVRHHVEMLATHDSLTGLANRRMFETALADSIAATIASGASSTVMLVDLDDFKDVNDTRGHAAGDALLIEVARRLRRTAGPRATVARLGGDEFALLLPDAQDDEAAAHVAMRLSAAIAAPVQLPEAVVLVACSIGIVRIPQGGTHPQQAMGNADLALYDAKAAGRGRFRFFDNAMRAAVEGKRETIAQFALALERGELELHYQPQLRLSDGKVAGFEALMRWHHPTRGLLLPGAFRAGLDDPRLSVIAGRWVAATAAAQNRAWLDAGLPPVRMAVNLSQAPFRDDDLPAVIGDALAMHDLDPALFEVEVTENILLDHTIEIDRPMRALHALGVSIALDDFGTGYASLSHLRRFPIDRIKIDRQFVRDIGRRVDGATISHAIVALGISLGIEVTAEGIETAEQERFLRLSGCHEVQGFHYAQAMPAAEAGEFLRERGAWARPAQARVA